MNCLVCGSSELSQVAFLTSIPAAAQQFTKSKPSPDVRGKYLTDLTAYQCFSCSHVQATTASYVPYYKDVISAASLSSDLLSERDQVVSHLCDLLESNNPTIFEIGAFRGQYIDHLRSLGYTNVSGLEHSMESVANASAQGIPILQGYMLDEQLPPDLPPDNEIILCYNFLEHIPDPFKFIQRIRVNLAANTSYLYFTMPSYSYIRDNQLLQEFVPDHISYFTPKSLAVLFLRSGLEIISLTSINNGNDLAIIAKHTSFDNLTLNSACLNRLISQINDVLDQAISDNSKVSFWGAGHRSLTLISQLKYSSIGQIVDSAPFKQDHFCPATGLKIVSPEFFYSNPSDVLILSLPGIYAQEVISKLTDLEVKVPLLYTIDGNELVAIKQKNT